MAKPKKADRIGELEDELKARDRRITELKADIGKQDNLIDRLREQIEDGNALIESWIESFDMVQDENGLWSAAPFFEAAEQWQEKYLALVRKWNAAVGDFNSIVRPRNVGRPLAASEAQCATVLKMRKAGASLRDIAEDTGLGLRTVRTVIDGRNGTDRTSIGHLARIAPDRQEVVAWQARKRTRAALPKRINETLTQGQALAREAKGLR